LLACVCISCVRLTPAGREVSWHGADGSHLLELQRVQREVEAGPAHAAGRVGPDAAADMFAIEEADVEDVLI
jgi:hypothetical protein